MKLNKEKITKRAENVRNYLFIMGFIFRNSPLLVIMTILFDMMTELPWMLSNVVLLKYIIDVIETGTDGYRVFIACGIFFATAEHTVSV